MEMKLTTKYNKYELNYKKYWKSEAYKVHNSIT